MTVRKRKRHAPEFKAQVALEAYKGNKTINQLANEHGVAAVQISQWKRQLLKQVPELFGRTVPDIDPEELTAPLYQEIGRLKMELDWLKKNLGQSVDHLRTLVDSTHSDISVRRQCELLGLNRSTLYYQGQPAQESAENLLLMELIDKQYTETPFYSSRKMTQWLIIQGHFVNRKRIQRLMRLMGIKGIAPKPGTSLRNKEHKVYPYLIRGLETKRPNQVWSTDITYYAMPQEFMYLRAIIDWYSRYVISWELSNTLGAEFCIIALEKALKLTEPEIFNTDQGCQFTSQDFLTLLLERDIKVSMDGKGRALDNIFVERLWRSVKYEWLYLHEFKTVAELHKGLEKYFQFYNAERLHQSLNYQTPQAIHFV